MPEERITITINENGKISARTEGFKGETCLEALDSILGEIGEQVEIKKTDEFFQKTNNQIINKQPIKSK